ncbi:hypothetical protein [Pontibacter sp. G13]|uniref:hypothetical protein n=1 Tax=Pontibacter sp. G13 TaxID=3074898 RepID=UPI002889213C|nr:hypothetical protein [Pontibacter sp. G13]WNJ17899.1 hypothetical protein RJD25_23850 [Pontibacter sp. G13]
MALKDIGEFQSIKGGLDDKSLDELLSKLLNYIKSKGLGWYTGAEAISDLLALRENPTSPPSEDVANEILEWISSNYDSSIFSSFSGSYEEGDSESERIVRTLEFTTDIFYQLSPSKGLISLIKDKLNQAKNDFEKYELNECLEYFENREPQDSSIPDAVRAELVERANHYFQSKFEDGTFSFILCGLPYTIHEYEYCFLIGWSLAEEKYTSRVKKSPIVGPGPLLLSKISNKTKLTGSAFHESDIEDFELEIRGLEAYWTLQFDFLKDKLGTYKTLLNLSSLELLKLSKSSDKISIEKSEQELRHLQEGLKSQGIPSTLELKTRKTA